MRGWVTRIADFTIYYPTSHQSRDLVTAIEWRAGRHSFYKNVDITASFNADGMRQEPKAVVKITGKGGGKWYGFDSIGFGKQVRSKINVNFRNILIDSTTEPLAFYNFSVEDGFQYTGTLGIHTSALADGWESEIRNSENIAIYGSKNENFNVLKVSNSRNIRIFGMGGKAQVRVSDSDNLLFIGFVEKDYNRSFYDSQRFRAVKSINNNIITGELSAEYPLGVFSQGYLPETTSRIENVCR